MTQESDISLLTQSQHVKARPTQFLGSIIPEYSFVPMIVDGEVELHKIEYIPACIRCVNEILENACDEHIRNNTPNPIINVTYNEVTKTISVEDNGRGVPIGIHSNGLPTPQVVYCYLGSGSNFNQNKKTGLNGQNGVGAACVNFCSNFFNVDVYRDKKHFNQQFINGTDTIKEPVVKRCLNHDTGTKVTFQLNEKIFPTVIPTIWFKIKCFELSSFISNLTVKLTILHEGNESTYIFSEKDNTRVKHENNTILKDSDCEINIISNKNFEQKTFGWINGGYLFDSGTCCADTQRAFVQETINYLTPTINKEKLKITKEDVLENVILFIKMSISDPLYDSQAKTRYKGPSQKPTIEQIFANQYKKFIKHNKPYFDELLERIRSKSNFKASKQIEKKQKIHFIEGYLKATSTDRSVTWLLLNEGLSAASQVSSARDPKIIGSLPLGGRMNNIFECTPSQLLSMPKIVDLLQVIGLVPGKKAVREELNYNHVVIATDADPDGDGIFVNLVNLFYQNWPELLSTKEPFLYRMCAPNIVAVTSKERIHFQTREQYEKNKHKIKAKYDIEYMKGLGSMTVSDWKQCLGNLNKMEPIKSDDEMSNWLEIFFSDDSNKRKEWLKECRQK